MPVINKPPATEITHDPLNGRVLGFQVRKWTWRNSSCNLTKSKIWDMVHRFVPENKCQSQRCWTCFFDVGQLGLDFGFVILGPFFQWDIPWKSKTKPLKALPHKHKYLPVTSSWKVSPNWVDLVVLETKHGYWNHTLKFSERLSPYSSWKIPTH